MYNNNMKDITRRQMVIIQIILEHGQITGTLISQLSGFSLRTIQNELAQLRNLEIIQSGKFGYRISSELSLVSISENESDEDFILRKLILGNNNLTLTKFCQDLYISETTLLKRISSITDFIKKYELTIRIHKNQIWIEGEEVSKRELIRDLIFSEVSQDPLSDNHLKEYFHDLNLEFVKRIITDTLSNFGYTYRNTYFDYILINIIISLSRIYKNIHTPTDGNFMVNSHEYSIANTICNRFSKHYNVTATDEDILYIASLLQGQIVKKDRAVYYQTMDNLGFLTKIDALVKSLFEYYMIIIESNYDVQSLAIHVYELIRRAKISNFITDTNQISMKENAPFIYDVAVHFTNSLEREFGVEIPASEIDFLAIHIGLILKKEKMVAPLVNVLLIAPDYQEISNRISNSLYEAFESKIRIKINSNYAQDIYEEKFDLIITTIKLKLLSKKIIEVSPLFDIAERTKVESLINDLIKEKEDQKNLKNLLSFFTPELFFITTDIKDSDQAISFLSSKLMNQGVVDADFQESVLQREQLSPTCFFDIFAIPHPLKMDAKETKIAVLINKEGIEWGSSNIKLCIMITTKKDEQHIFRNSYNGLVSILTDKIRLANLINSNTYEEFICSISIVP